MKVVKRDQLNLQVCKGRNGQAFGVFLLLCCVCVHRLNRTQLPGVEEGRIALSTRGTHCGRRANSIQSLLPSSDLTSDSEPGVVRQERACCLVPRLLRGWDQYHVQAAA